MRLSFWMLLAVCLWPALGWSQYSVDGRVLDARSAEPLVGANVMVSGTSQLRICGFLSCFVF